MVCSTTGNLVPWPVPSTGRSQCLDVSFRASPRPTRRPIGRLRQAFHRHLLRMVPLGTHRLRGLASSASPSSGRRGRGSSVPCGRTRKRNQCLAAAHTEEKDNVLTTSHSVRPVSLLSIREAAVGAHGALRVGRRSRLGRNPSCLYSVAPLANRKITPKKPG